MVWCHGWTTYSDRSFSMCSDDYDPADTAVIDRAVLHLLMTISFDNLNRSYYESG